MTITDITNPTSSRPRLDGRRDQAETLRRGRVLDLLATAGSTLSETERLTALADVAEIAGLDRGEFYDECVRRHQAATASILADEEADAARAEGRRF